MKAALALVLIVASLSSFAQSRGRNDNRNDNRPVEGQITMRDGRTTVRINVGEDDRDQNMRIRRLEQAVRDLQAQVYDLQDVQVQTRIQTTHVCSMVTPFTGTFVGKASTRIEAEAVTRQRCQQGRGDFCSTNAVRCEVVQEEIVIR